MKPPRRFFVFAAIGLCVLQMLQGTSCKDCRQPLLNEPVEAKVVEGENLLLNIILQGQIFESETQFLWKNKTRGLLATKSCNKSNSPMILKCGIDGYRSLHYAVIYIPAVHADASIQILEILITSSEHDGSGIYKLETPHKHEFDGTHSCTFLDVNLTVLRGGPMPTSQSDKTVQVSFNATSMAFISYFYKSPLNTLNVTFNVLVMVALVISILTAVQQCGVRLYRASKSRKRVKRCPVNQFDP